MQQTVAFLTSNLFFFFSTLKWFLSLLYYFWAHLALSLFYTHTNTCTHSIRIIKKLLPFQSLFYNLMFRSKCWKSLLPDLYSHSLFCICGALGLFQEQSFKSMALSRTHSGDIPLYSSSGSEHLFVLCGVASNTEQTCTLKKQMEPNGLGNCNATSSGNIFKQYDLESEIKVSNHWRRSCKPCMDYETRDNLTNGCFLLSVCMCTPVGLCPSLIHHW